MDGVLVHEGLALPGAADFLERLVAAGRRFLVLTNNSIFTPRDLSARLARSGLQVPEASIWTSALATADFLATQLPGGSAYVIGEAGLTTALYEAGYTLTDTDPDNVVVAGIEAGLDTILVLTGSTQAADVASFPFRPGRVLDSIADVVDLV